ncbi:hypothetical protein PQO03_06690 [Lentisphaera profundi]|uniref:Pectinesterase n=1 Tax=Lentisphaera profundi TaxID=1658616 RepID=A0ABY7VMW7_9BACT|nr:hypothetical protein [Lentisphaera profundi]WDE95403.1 hypothetical protein PQO03_06690 [Lentisphaera profundi]
MYKIILWILKTFKYWLINFILIITAIVAFVWIKTAINNIVENEQRTAVIENKLTELKNEKGGFEKSIANQQKKILAIRANIQDSKKIITKHSLSVQMIDLKIEAIKDEYTIKDLIPGTNAYLKLTTLKTTKKTTENIISRQRELQNKYREWAINSPEAKAIKKLRKQITSLENSINGEQKNLATNKKEIADDVVAKLHHKYGEQFQSALLILLGTILSPVLIRFFLYYILAAGAGRCRPITLLKDSAAITDFSESQETLEITLDDQEELLINPEYLQSSNMNFSCKTQYFLNKKFFITCIVANLFTLTRIRDTTKTPISISSTKNPFIKTATATLPKGSAMICHPRSLIGVIKKQSDNVVISRHWRILYLHSWCTLQFRYLAFHGECTLIFKGCRGVKIKKATDGTLIGQSSTLAFSANALYSNKRCETFISYFTGKDDLFNDCIAGSESHYVQEEIASDGNGSGVKSKGLEGFVDACLKVFGM